MNDGLRIDVSGRTLSARSLGLTFMAKERIELVPRMETSGLRLRVVDSKMAERTYPGSLVISVKGTAMQLVNAVPLEAYTAGVVQAEAGKDHNGEYYKLQSVSCRTYALCNHRKHVADGFELCDAVHCQVYRGQCKQDSIKKAVEETRGMVLVDPDIKLIHALFHSNCGGETINAEDLMDQTGTVPTLHHGRVLQSGSPCHLEADLHPEGMDQLLGKEVPCAKRGLRRLPELCAGLP